ncbi:hypothetical protein CPT_Seuss15 [Caulobacter phage Seuss]|uniref:Uncharacterized protein n=1 Tax=Caulobacter phage Seuss TaxID=1675601 RepID=A0A0K1LM11_9CAUD|nr:hypothetical protein HOR08_gp015 [Caulobacter phage Seuss]AKU43541.1 hypothetical protein CPT_Seuss15 [Caulobacter phage Seuss]
MLTFHAGQSVVVAVPLTRDGEPFLADAGAKWTLRDHTGLPMPAYTDQAVADVSDTTLIITIPSGAQTIDSSRLFEKRFVVVSGTSNAIPFEVTLAYRLVAWMNYSITADSVRSFLGVDPGELADHDIDLPAAYLELASVAGVTAVQDALNSGTRLESLANNAIKGYAALACLPGLRQRVSKKAEDGSMKVERFTVDFDRLEADARRLVMEGTTGLGTSLDDLTAPVLFVLVTPTTDVITGEAPA